MIAGKLKIRKTEINKANSAEYRTLWKPLTKNPSLYYPAIYSHVSAVQAAHYTPENVYYNWIELILNNKAFTPAYADKNVYEILLKKHAAVFPETVLRGINGVVYNHAYEVLAALNPKSIGEHFKPKKQYVLKPSIETSGGANFSILERENDDFKINNNLIPFEELLSLLNNHYGGSFVIQERIIQHPWFSRFNQSSVNTVRIFTYRSVLSNTVHPLHAIVRFGREGSLVDNQAAGGLSCGVDERGFLKAYAIDKYGKKHHDIPAVRDRAGEALPGVEEMKKLAVEIASKYPYHRVLGFDFCLDNENKVRLLEINCKNIETNFLQMNNGPLFGDFTQEVINYCSQNKRSVVFDFYI